jgi:very-short-patch-repair endonuclease
MEEPFKNYGTDEQPLYIAGEVFRYFGFTHEANQSRYIKQLKPNEAIRSYRLPDNMVKKNRVRNMLTLKGLKRFLCYTRKNVSPEILNYYGITEHNKINVDERLWLAHIKKSFVCEEVIEQFALDTYRLDAYFPAHNIVIEVDEHGHAEYNVADEAARTARVNQVLKNPTWIRFDPYKADIFEVIGLIYAAIKK